MATKRNVLDLLSRDELLAAMDRLGLAVRDRRGRAFLLDALTVSKKVRLQNLLAVSAVGRGAPGEERLV